MDKNAAENEPVKAKKYFDDQFDDEEVLYVFRKHPIVMRKGIIYSSIAVLIGPLYVLALTFFRPNNLPSVSFFFLSLAASAALAAIVFLPSWITWHFSVYIVTDQRLIQIVQKGLFHRSVVDMSLTQIQMVNYEISGLEQTLLGFGTIMMQTLVGDLMIHEVHKPAKIQKKILEILRDQGVNATSYAASAPINDEFDEAED
jgi:membrane protein YdbS with pleckstrin-like domain